MNFAPALETQSPTVSTENEQLTETARLDKDVMNMAREIIQRRRTRTGERIKIGSYLSAVLRKYLRPDYEAEMELLFRQAGPGERKGKKPDRKE